MIFFLVWTTFFLTSGLMTSPIKGILALGFLTVEATFDFLYSILALVIHWPKTAFWYFSMLGRRRRIKFLAEIPWLGLFALSLLF